jgi:5-methylcytosine-specific restriction endonuclease McrA
METLVLDQSYLPVARVHWQRAITLFFMGKVEIVDEYEDQEIHSMTFSMKMPSIVRFIRSIRSKKKAVKFSRENVYARDKGKCQYCGHLVARHEATYDHVVPRAAGGKTEWNNVVICCYTCNQKKSCRTPEQAGMRLKAMPIRPKNLPDVRITIVWRRGDPEAWRSFCRDYTYWNAELEP